MKRTIKDILALFPNTTEADWTQHANGGGWKQNTTTVADTAFVEGIVYDNARVFDNARVYDNALVLHGTAARPRRPNRRFAAAGRSPRSQEALRTLPASPAGHAPVVSGQDDDPR